MFTLKLRFLRHNAAAPGMPCEIAEEATYFIEADEVIDRGVVHGNDWQDRMKAWDRDDYHQLLSCTFYDDGTDPFWMDGHLLQVDRGDKSRWFLVSLAWLLGPDGRTIERLT